jgi:hypothetical protein
MPQEMAMLQLLNQTGNGWLTAALLTGLLLALLFKPERVYSWALLRLSCWFLALSITIPPILNAFMTITSHSAASFRPTSIGSSDYLVITCIYALGPILLGISIICGLLAMIPTGYRPPLTPAKHPLE